MLETTLDRPWLQITDDLSVPSREVMRARYHQNFMTGSDTKMQTDGTAIAQPRHLLQIQRTVGRRVHRAHAHEAGGRGDIKTSAGSAAAWTETTLPTVHPGAEQPP
jgi:hypothetical protein